MPVPSFNSNKFRPATLPQTCAPRTILISEIESAVSHSNVIISAPAGSGKTTAALLWLQRANRKAIWIGLDEYDNVPSIFFDYFAVF